MEKPFLTAKDSQGRRWSFTLSDPYIIEKDFCNIIEQLKTLRWVEKEGFNKSLSLIPAKLVDDSYIAGPEGWSEAVRDCNFPPIVLSDESLPSSEQLLPEEPAKLQKTKQLSKIINFPQKRHK